MKDITKEKLIFLLIPVVTIIVIAVIIYFYYVQPTEPAPLIEHSLAQISNAPLLLSPNKRFSNALLENRIELITFWNSKCSDCIEQQNLLLFLANAHLVNDYGIDFQDSSPDAKKFLLKHGDPFKEIAVDKDGRIGILLGIDTIPETFLIDKQGKIRDKILGPITPIIWFDRLKPEIIKLREQSNQY